MTQAEDILRRRRNVKFGDPNNFDIKTADKFIEQFDSITAMVDLIAIAISSLGAAGRWNRCDEYHAGERHRTHERDWSPESVGRPPERYRAAVLFEAMTLTFLGGILGVVLLAVGISRIVMLLVPSLPASIPTWAVVTGLSVSIGVGLILVSGPLAKLRASIPSSACATNK